MCGLSICQHLWWISSLMCCCFVLWHSSLLAILSGWWIVRIFLTQVLMNNKGVMWLAQQPLLSSTNVRYSLKLGINMSGTHWSWVYSGASFPEIKNPRLNPWPSVWKPTALLLSHILTLSFWCGLHSGYCLLLQPEAKNLWFLDAPDPILPLMLIAQLFWDFFFVT